MPPPNAPLHRILVVDDEPDITALVAYHLAKAGYRVATATNGRDALQAAREERPDLVVLDLMHPGLSGYEVLVDLRGRLFGEALLAPGARAARGCRVAPPRGASGGRRRRAGGRPHQPGQER